MIDWQAVFYIVAGLLFSIGGYLYKELKSKVDKIHEDALTYRTLVATTYVTNDHLAKAVENLNKTVDNVASGILRIEARLNNQIDNHANRNGNHTQ